MLRGRRHEAPPGEHDAVHLHLVARGAAWEDVVPAQVGPVFDACYGDEVDFFGG